jgi:drug/metabolite transporter (DMT)-like permease
MGREKSFMLAGIPWWIIAISGSLILTIRNSLGKSVAPLASAKTITFCRFFFSALFGIPLFLFLYSSSAIHPIFTTDFWIAIGINTLLQTSASILIFYGYRNGKFGVLTVFSKSIVIFTLINGALFFGEIPAIQAIFGMLLALTGLVWLQIVEEKKNVVPNPKKQVVSLEIVAIVGGSLLLAFANFFSKQATHLTDAVTTSTFMFVGNSIFGLIIGIRTLWKERTYILSQSNNLLLFGFFAFLTTIIYVYAFSIAPVAYVEMVTQLEVIFAGLIAFWYFKEKSIVKRTPQILLTIIGIAMIVLSH